MPRRRPLDQHDVRRVALALPETREGSHFGHADLRVANKIFAGLPNGSARVNLKSTAINVDALVRADPTTYRNAWAGTWLGVDLTRVDTKTLRELIHDAWRLAAPKRLLDTPVPRNKPKQDARAPKRQRGTRRD